jgi:transcriptional regulator with XRE-family HTH domain
MVGPEIRRARLDAGLTQEALARRARMDRSYLSDLERDLQIPSLVVLRKICRALGIPIASLIADAEKRWKYKKS